MLNYAYAVLENNVRTQVVGAGLDPTIMEPLRPVVDRCVLEFVQRHVFEPGDFTLTREGVCRLNPELARSIVGIASNALGHSARNRQFAQSQLPRLLSAGRA